MNWVLLAIAAVVVLASGAETQTSADSTSVLGDVEDAIATIPGVGDIVGIVNSAMVEAMMQAIARAEGFYVNGSLPQRANNPGDLTDDGDVGYGTLGGAHITVYASVDDGWAALRKKVTRMLAGHSRTYPITLSLAQVGQLYANGDSNWANNVAAALGVSTDTTLADLANS